MIDNKREYMPEEHEMNDPEGNLQNQPLITKNIERKHSHNDSIHEV